MGSEVATAFVALMPSTSGFGAATQRQLTPQMTTAGRTAGSRFGRVFATATMSPLRAIGAAAVGLFAVAKVKEFFGGAIAEARESQKVSALTAQVIKTTGGAAGVSAKQVGDLAGSISRLTGIDDEAIQGASNLLLTFTNLRNEVGKGNDIFNQATGIVTDMSVALDQSLKSSSVQVGKALNDPIKGLTALSRVGVAFTDQQKKQIETLVESGDRLGAQKIILGELRKEFGGAAAAAATSGDRFKTAFANLQETIGLALLPYLDRLLDKGTVVIGFLMTQVPAAFAAIKSAIEPVTSVLGDFIGDHLEAFHTALAALGGGAIAAVVALIGGGLVAAISALVGVLASPVVLIGAMVGALIYAYTHFAGFRDVVGQVVDYVRGNLIPAFSEVVASVRAFVSAAIPIVQEFASGLLERLLPLVPRVVGVFQQIGSTIASALQLVAAIVRVVVGAMVLVWQNFGSIILDYVGRTFSNIVTVVSGVLNVLQGVIRLVLSLIKGDWSGAWDALKQIVGGVWQIIQGLVSQALNFLRTVLAAAWVVIKAAAKAAWDGIKQIPGLALKAAVAIVRAELALIGAVARAAWNGIKAVASAVWNAIKATVAAQVSAVKGAVGGLADLVGKVRGWFGDILSAIKSKLGEAVAYAKGIPGKMVAALGSGLMKLYGVGKDLILGFINGIKSMAGAVLDAVGGVIDDAVGWAKSKLKIGSPSKLFHQFGGWTIEGFANGIIAAAPGAVAAVSDMATKVQVAVLDRLTDMRDKAKSVIDGLVSDFKGLREAVASNFTGDLWSFDNASDFLVNLVRTKGTLRKLKGAFKKLLGWGVAPEFLSSLFQNGGAGLILDLADGDRISALTAASLFDDVNQLGNQLGGQVAGADIGPELRAQTRELRDINRAIKGLPKNFAREINNAVKHGKDKAA